jgi:hypothetical protein
MVARERWGEMRTFSFGGLTYHTIALFGAPQPSSDPHALPNTSGADDPTCFSRENDSTWDFFHKMPHPTQLEQA